MASNKEREKKTLELATKEKFFKPADEVEITQIAQCIQNDEIEGNEDILVVSLPRRRLNSIEAVGKFENLQICNLAGNFIADISSLKHCRLIIKLDVHSNQLSRIPPPTFWQLFQRLIVLCLHDNNIHDVEDVKSLEAAHNLTILTMHDTPASLNRFYRHLAVNAIWSLKVLDDYVVSDEEIIEGAIFNNKFSGLQQNFCIKNRLSCLKEIQPLIHQDTLTLEKRCILQDVQLINQIQARCCPVLFIQRHIRGYLQRKKYSSALDNRLWAAVSIQRFYRKFKGIPNPPPTSPVLKRKRGDAQSSISSLKFDYDSYLDRQRSLIDSFTSQCGSLSLSPRNEKIGGANHVNKQKESSRPFRLDVHVPVLSQSMSMFLDDSGPDYVKMTQESLKKSQKKFSRRFQQPSKDNDWSKTDLASTVRSGLQGRSDTKRNKELGTVRGEQKMLLENNQLKEHFTEIVKAAAMVRESIKNSHKQMLDRAASVKIVTQKKRKSSQNEVDQTSLSCFRAIDKAYADQRKLSHQVAKERDVQIKRSQGQRRQSVIKSCRIKQPSKSHCTKYHDESKMKEQVSDKDIPNNNTLRSVVESSKKDRQIATHLKCQFNKINNTIMQQEMTEAKHRRAAQLIERVADMRQERLIKTKDCTINSKVLPLTTKLDEPSRAICYSQRYGGIIESAKHKIVSDSCHHTNQSLTGPVKAVTCQRINVGGTTLLDR